MKTSLKALQRDERERQEDDLLRAQLDKEDRAEAAAKRQKAKEDNFSKKWRDCLDKWDADGLECASERELLLPIPNPPGPHPLSFLLKFIYLFILLGATLQKGSLPRNASPLSCLDALLTPEAWEALVAGTNSHLAKARSTGELKGDRHYANVTVSGLKSVFFARLHMIATGARTIDEAYKVPVFEPNS